MKNNLKKLLSVGLITATLIGGGQAVHAGIATPPAKYAGKVPTFQDFETTSLKKNTETNAINNCASIGDGKLVSWIEDDGSNITGKTAYTSTGRKAMSYADAKDNVGDVVLLNISTSTGTLHSIDTTGTWSPDDKNDPK